MTIHDSVDSHKFYNFRSQNSANHTGHQQRQRRHQTNRTIAVTFLTAKAQKRTSMAPHIQVTSYFPQPIFIKFLSHKLLVVSLMAELLNATNLRLATNSKSGRGCESTARCILEPILDDAARLES